MKTGKYFRLSVVFAVVSVMTACLFLLPGCGEDKAAMQAFAEGVVDVMNQLQSKPEVAQEGRTAAMAYMNSGYTDLESAAKAQASYEESGKNDQEAIKELDALQKPDDDAEKIAKELREGILKVDEGNTKFAENYAKAPEQTVEERQATAADVMAPMTLYVDGMTKIVASLKDLKDYVESNDLESVTEVGKWYDQIKGELEEVKKYLTQ